MDPDTPADGTAPHTAPEPFSMTSSRGCAHWLHETGGSLAFSTYQANKLFLIGTKQSGHTPVRV